jgi:hypothetical protein
MDSLHLLSIRVAIRGPESRRPAHLDLRLTRYLTTSSSRTRALATFSSWAQRPCSQACCRSGTTPPATTGWTEAICRTVSQSALGPGAVGLPHNAGYRGSLERITSTELQAVLLTRRKLSWNVFSQMTAPKRLAARHRRQRPRAAVRPSRGLPQASYAGILSQLCNWIASLEPRDHGPTLWSYETAHTYKDEEHLVQTGVRRTIRRRSAAVPRLGSRL